MPSFDSTLRLYDGNGQFLRYVDDHGIDPGTVHSFDAYMEHELSTAGTYYIVVGDWLYGEVRSGASYKLHVSVGEPAPSDILAPELTLPDDITEEATGSDGATVSYTATATDNVDSSVSVDCTPASGTIFALGTTQVNCSATDAAGNQATGSFKVTVQDTTKPTISNVPANISKTATSSSGATVNYAAPTATDIVDSSVNVNCSPASDSTFPLGKTTVNCEAADAAGNKASASFDVDVTYSWSGLLQPINGGTTLNNKTDDTSAFKLGSTVPVKFKLTGASAAINNATAKIVVTKIDGTPDGTQVEATSTNAPDSGSTFRYDSAGAQYIFNWGTKSLSAGDYLIKIDLGDGTTATNAVKVSLKK